MDTKYPRRILAKIRAHFEDEQKHLEKRLGQIDESDPYKDPDHANDNADIGLLYRIFPQPADVANPGWP